MSVTIQAVDRALHILNLLAANSDGLSNREIAKQVGLNISTTHHLVNTLAAQGYVHRLDGSRYCLGHTIARLHNAYLSNVNPNAHLYDALNKLAEATGETAYLCISHNGHALIQGMVEGSQAVRVGGLYVGFIGNTHLRAAGKVLLAYLGEQELNAYLATADFTPLTAKSVRDSRQLKEQLWKIVKHGYAVDQGEFADDVSCVAAPIFSAEGAIVAALGISAPDQRFVRLRDQLIGTVVHAAHNASRMIGHKSSGQSDTREGDWQNDAVQRNHRQDKSGATLARKRAEQASFLRRRTRRTLPNKRGKRSGNR